MEYPAQSHKLKANLSQEIKLKQRDQSRQLAKSGTNAGIRFLNPPSNCDHLQSWLWCLLKLVPGKMLFIFLGRKVCTLLLEQITQKVVNHPPLSKFIALELLAQNYCMDCQCNHFVHRAIFWKLFLASLNFYRLPMFLESCFLSSAKASSIRQVFHVVMPSQSSLF